MNKIPFAREIAGEQVILSAPLATPDHAAEMFELLRCNGYFYPWRFSLSSCTSPEAAFALIEKRVAAIEAMADAYYDIYSDGRYVGEIYARDIEYDGGIVGNLGYFVDKDFQGRGVAGEAVGLLSDHLFDRGAHRINLFCHFFGDLVNVASEAVAKKCGYRFEGTAREAIWDPIGKRYADEHRFAKLSNER